MCMRVRTDAFMAVRVKRNVRVHRHLTRALPHVLPLFAVAGQMYRCNPWLEAYQSLKGIAETVTCFDVHV